MKALLRRLRRWLGWRSAAVEEWEHRRCGGASTMLDWPAPSRPISPQTLQSIPRARPVPSRPIPPQRHP